MTRALERISLWTILTMAGLLTGAMATDAKELRSVPDAAFQELNGSVITPSAFRGKVVLLNFWGTWCVPCLQEIPELVRLSRQFKSRGLEIVGIAVDSGRPDDIRQFMAAHGMDYQVLIGDLAIVKQSFQVVGFPTSLLIDRHGIIQKRYFGPQTEAVLKRDVEPLF